MYKHKVHRDYGGRTGCGLRIPICKPSERTKVMLLTMKSEEVTCEVVEMADLLKLNYKIILITIVVCLAILEWLSSVCEE